MKKGRGKSGYSWSGILWDMIEVTKLNDEKVTVNADLIEMIEEVPETVITFTNGKKIFVKESRQKVKNLVILYRMEIFNPTLEKEM